MNALETQAAEKLLNHFLASDLDHANTRSLLEQYKLLCDAAQMRHFTESYRESSMTRIDMSNPDPDSDERP